MRKFTAEQVRQRAASVQCGPLETDLTAQMLFELAERIAANEVADGNDPITEYYEDRNRTRSQGGFTHPKNAETKPAQAAQVDALRNAYRAGFVEACGWGCPVTGDMESPAFESALQEFISAAPAAAPVTQVDRSDALDQAEEDTALEGYSKPVAQSEVVDVDTITLHAAKEIALMWGQDRSQFVAKIQVRILDAMRRVRGAPLFSDASALANWLETLHECHADGAVNARKWEPAQIAAKAVREATQPAERVVDVFADAENWGSALNSAAWVFTEVCPEKSVLLFNNTKLALRAAILKYLEKVTAT